MIKVKVEKKGGIWYGISDYRGYWSSGEDPDKVLFALSVQFQCEGISDYRVVPVSEWTPDNEPHKER